MATVNFIKYKKQSAGALSGVTRYILQDEKTLDENGRQLVSGQNCTPQLADREFQATRSAHRKDSPVWFYHYVQSFSPDEVITGEQAHQLAKEFAAKAWPDSEVLIATHLDAEHIHSHFVVNAVCWESGKMLRQGPNTLHSLRQLSDELCLAHGFSVLPQERKNQTQGMGTREYRSAAKGQSWKFRLMNTIDQCMRYASTKEEFLSLMESEGYRVHWTDGRKNITYTTPTGMKCRDDRLHETKYTKEVMEHEFRIRAEIVSGGIEGAERSADYDTAGLSQQGGVTGVAPSGWTSWSGTRRPTQPFCGRFPAGRNCTPPRSSWRHCRGGGANVYRTETGWEEERDIYLAARFGYGAVRTGLAAPAGDAGGHGGLADHLVRLGRSLERGQDADPLMDSTTMRHRSDRKTLRKEQEKKIALGHKEDDHEEEQAWQQTMS